MKIMYIASPNFSIKLVSLISIGSFIPMLKTSKKQFTKFLAMDVDANIYNTLL